VLLLHGIKRLRPSRAKGKDKNVAADLTESREWIAVFVGIISETGLTARMKKYPRCQEGGWKKNNRKSEYVGGIACRVKKGRTLTAGIRGTIEKKVTASKEGARKS